LINVRQSQSRNGTGEHNTLPLSGEFTLLVNGHLGSVCFWTIYHTSLPPFFVYVWCVCVCVLDAGKDCSDVLRLGILSRSDGLRPSSCLEAHWSVRQSCWTMAM